MRTPCDDPADAGRKLSRLSSRLLLLGLALGALGRLAPDIADTSVRATPQPAPAAVRMAQTR